jgi:beta-lactam-binding protein with PASTA domain
MAKTNFSSSPEWPKGTVIEQSPGLGAKVTSETPIELTIAQ